MLSSLRSGRVVVISPHLDDAVLSLGSSIARLTSRGVDVEVLTVFGCDPSSTVAASGWDRRAGFSNEGSAAAARREEDREACGIVGARPQVLGFRGGSYGGPSESEAAWLSIAETVAGAEAVLIPGFPLTNDDHRWLHALLTTRPLPCGRLGLYAEQPYRYVVRRKHSAPMTESTFGHVYWETAGPGLRYVLLKKRAILAYRSQIALLGLSARRHLKLNLMLLHELGHRGEAIAEVDLAPKR
jgi:LmbE family N-acetylglucosaminyl deacetylase